MEEGQRQPSRAQLLRMAKHFRRPLLTFYLAQPPKKGERGNDFRTLPPDRVQQNEPLLDPLIRDVKARQSIVRAIAEEEEDGRPLAFIGSARIADGAAPLVAKIRSALNFDLQKYREARTTSEAFDYLRGRAEALGVYVLLIGDLGSYHSAISVEAFRGYVLADPVAPFIVINDRDAKSAWSFSLLHELAHLWIGQTGISGRSIENPVEQFCNEVAAELLLPRDEIGAAVGPGGGDTEKLLTWIAEYARARNLSRPMVAYRYYKAGGVSLEDWRRVDQRLYQMWREEREVARERAKIERTTGGGGGPNYYVVRRHRLGRALLEFANRNVSAGSLSTVKAAKVLGVKPRAVYPLLADIVDARAE